MKVETPAVTSIPPAVTLTPVLAVISPIESTLVLSSTVKVPPIVTLPLNSAVAATIFPVNVETPATTSSSKSVCPSTSNPPVPISTAPSTLRLLVNVETPVTFNSSNSVGPSTSIPPVFTSSCMNEETPAALIPVVTPEITNPPVPTLIESPLFPM